MKNLLLLAAMLIGTLVFGQAKKQPSLDVKINKTLDSLSEIYQKKVFGIMRYRNNDTISRTIYYLKNSEEYSEVVFLSVKGKRIK
jgi:hypothetical protein